MECGVTPEILALYTSYFRAFPYPVLRYLDTAPPIVTFYHVLGHSPNYPSLTTPFILAILHT